MKYFKNAQIGLIGNYYTVYSNDYSVDSAFENKILAYGDKWLEQLLIAIRKAKRTLPLYLYVKEGGKVLKAYLASTSGYLEHTYVTSTKIYQYLPDKDLKVEGNLRINSLYSDEDLEILIESNWIHSERIRDVVYYERIGNVEALARHRNFLSSAKRSSNRINQKRKLQGLKVKVEVIGTRTIECVYGSDKQRTDVIICDLCDNTSWYVCEGFRNVNQCYTEELDDDSIDIELVMDIDVFTSSEKIVSESQLRASVEETVNDY